MGEGFWRNSETGAKIKYQLTRTYPGFFNLWKKAKFLPVSKTFEYDEIEEVNQWLINFAGVDQIDKLKSKCYVELPDLLLHYNHILDILDYIQAFKDSQQSLLAEKLMPEASIIVSRPKVVLKITEAIPGVNLEEGALKDISNSIKAKIF
jgi:hypothetical protein